MRSTLIQQQASALHQSNTRVKLSTLIPSQPSSLHNSKRLPVTLSTLIIQPQFPQASTLYNCNARQLIDSKTAFQ